MGKDLDINSKIQNYIQDLSKKLHPVQSEIISYNESLGDIKRMQIAESQCHFLELITKISNNIRNRNIYWSQYIINGFRFTR